MKNIDSAERKKFILYLQIDYDIMELFVQKFEFSI